MDCINVIWLYHTVGITGCLDSLYCHSFGNTTFLLPNISERERRQIANSKNMNVKADAMQNRFLRFYSLCT